MADRIPLILNTNANQIQEMPSGDTLDLTGSNVNGVGILTCGSISSRITGNVDIQAGILSTTGNIDANGIIEGIAGQNKIPSLYNAMTDLPSAGTYHGMFAHVHATQRGYFAHGGGWYELVNKEASGVVGTGTESYNVGNVKVGSGVTIESNGQATFTGIVTFGSNSTTIGDNVVNVGTALTLGHTQGVQFHTQNLHSQGFEVNQINATGIITATSLSSSGDANTKINFPAADTITAETGGSERLRIDSNGRLLLGGTTTEGHPAADELTIANTTNAADMGITLRSATNGQGSIYFSDGTSGDAEYRGIINYNHTSDFLNFYTAAGERFRIASNGAIGLSGANYGSSGQVLTSQGSSSAPTWATPSGGKILQTVNATATSQVERTSSGFADTGLTANITLSAANKVLIFVAQALEARQYNATGFAVGRLKLVRITSGVYYNIFGPGGRSIVTSGPGSGSYFIASGCIASIVAEDSPGVGTHTYATQIARTVGGGGTAVRANSDGHPAEIILMEVEA